MLFAEIAILFIAGFCQDILNTVYYRAVAEKQLWRSTILSGLATAMGFAICILIWEHIKDAQGFANITSYALGNSMGTWLVMTKMKGKTA